MHSDDVGPDIAGLEQALDRLRACPALARDRDGAPAAALARREEAVRRLAQEVQWRLKAREIPATLAQGLRRLEDTLYRPLAFADPAVLPGEALPAEALALLERFDESLARARAAARELLEAELGLTMMTPEVGEAVDPARHNVIGSVSGDDPACDNTVAQVEAPGWMLGDVVLAQADVIRHSCSSAGVPMLPALDEVRAPALDSGMVGRRTGGGRDEPEAKCAGPDDNCLENAENGGIGD